MRCFIFTCKQKPWTDPCCSDCPDRQVCHDPCINNPEICSQAMPDDFDEIVAEMRGHVQSEGAEKKGSTRKEPDHQ